MLAQPAKKALDANAVHHLRASWKPTGRDDLVICPASCISHNAYWRVKEQCKRTGKPCVFLRSPGVSSFQRVIEEVSTNDNESKRY